MRCNSRLTVVAAAVLFVFHDRRIAFVFNYSSKVCIKPQLPRQHILFIYLLLCFRFAILSCDFISSFVDLEEKEEGFSVHHQAVPSILCQPTFLRHKDSCPGWVGLTPSTWQEEPVILCRGSLRVCPMNLGAWGRSIACVSLAKVPTSPTPQGGLVVSLNWDDDKSSVGQSRLHIPGRILPALAGKHDSPYQLLSPREKRGKGGGNQLSIFWGQS